MLLCSTGNGVGSKQGEQRKIQYLNTLIEENELLNMLVIRAACSGTADRLSHWKDVGRSSAQLFLPVGAGVQGI